MEAVTDFIFLDSKTTADSDCNHEIKRRLLFERMGHISWLHFFIFYLLLRLL